MKPILVGFPAHLHLGSSPLWLPSSSLTILKLSESLKMGLSQGPSTWALPTSLQSILTDPSVTTSKSPLLTASWATSVRGLLSRNRAVLSPCMTPEWTLIVFVGRQ